MGVMVVTHSHCNLVWQGVMSAFFFLKQKKVVCMVIIVIKIHKCPVLT